jgi:hypothetical protein
LNALGRIDDVATEATLLAQMPVPQNLLFPETVLLVKFAQI